MFVRDRNLDTGILFNDDIKRQGYVALAVGE